MMRCVGRGTNGRSIKVLNTFRATQAVVASLSVSGDTGMPQVAQLCVGGHGGYGSVVPSHAKCDVATLTLAHRQFSSYNSPRPPSSKSRPAQVSASGAEGRPTSPSVRLSPQSFADGDRREGEMGERAPGRTREASSKPGQHSVARPGRVIFPDAQDFDEPFYTADEGSRHTDVNGTSTFTHGTASRGEKQVPRKENTNSAAAGAKMPLLPQRSPEKVRDRYQKLYVKEVVEPLKFTSTFSSHHNTVEAEEEEVDDAENDVDENDDSDGEEDGSLVTPIAGGAAGARSSSVNNPSALRTASEAKMGAERDRDDDEGWEEEEAEPPDELYEMRGGRIVNVTEGRSSSVPPQQPADALKPSRGADQNGWGDVTHTRTRHESEAAVHVTRGAVMEESDEADWGDALPSTTPASNGVGKGPTPRAAASSGVDPTRKGGGTDEIDAVEDEERGEGEIVASSLHADVVEEIDHEEIAADASPAGEAEDLSSFVNVRRHPFYAELLRLTDRKIERFKRKGTLLRAGKYTPEVVNECIRPLLQLADYPFTIDSLVQLAKSIDAGQLRRTLPDQKACRRLHLYRSADTGVILDWSVEDFLRRRYESIHLSWEPVSIVYRRFGWSPAVMSDRDCLNFFREFREFVELAQLDRGESGDGPPRALAIPTVGASDADPPLVIPVSQLLIRRKPDPSTEPSLTECIRLMGIPSLAPHKSSQRHTESHAVHTMFSQISNEAQGVDANEEAKLVHALSVVPSLKQAVRPKGRSISEFSLGDAAGAADDVTEGNQSTTKRLAAVTKPTLSQDPPTPEMQGAPWMGPVGKVMPDTVAAQGAAKEYEALSNAFHKAKVEVSLLRRRLLATEGVDASNELQGKLTAARRRVFDMGQRLDQLRSLRHGDRGTTERRASLDARSDGDRFPKKDSAAAERLTADPEYDTATADDVADLDDIDPQGPARAVPGADATRPSQPGRDEQKATSLAESLSDVAALIGSDEKPGSVGRTPKSTRESGASGESSSQEALLSTAAEQLRQEIGLLREKRMQEYELLQKRIQSAQDALLQLSEKIMEESCKREAKVATAAAEEAERARQAAAAEEREREEREAREERERKNREAARAAAELEGNRIRAQVEARALVATEELRRQQEAAQEALRQQREAAEMAAREAELARGRQQEAELAAENAEMALQQHLREAQEAIRSAEKRKEELLAEWADVHDEASDAVSVHPKDMVGAASSAAELHAPNPLLAGMVTEEAAAPATTHTPATPAPSGSGWAFRCTPDQYDGMKIAAQRLRREIVLLENQMEVEGHEDDPTLMSVLAASRADLEELDDFIAQVRRTCAWAAERDREQERRNVTDEAAEVDPRVSQLKEKIETLRFGIRLLKKRIQHTTQQSIVMKLEQKVITSRREISRLRIELDRLRRASGRNGITGTSVEDFPLVETLDPDNDSTMHDAIIGDDVDVEEAYYRHVREGGESAPLEEEEGADSPLNRSDADPSRRAEQIVEKAANEVAIADEEELADFAPKRVLKSPRALMGNSSSAKQTARDATGDSVGETDDVEASPAPSPLEDEDVAAAADARQPAAGRSGRSVSNGGAAPVNATAKAVEAAVEDEAEEREEPLLHSAELVNMETCRGGQREIDRLKGKLSDLVLEIDYLHDNISSQRVIAASKGPTSKLATAAVQQMQRKAVELETMKSSVEQRLRQIMSTRERDLHGGPEDDGPSVPLRTSPTASPLSAARTRATSVAAPLPVTSENEVGSAAGASGPQPTSRRFITHGHSAKKRIVAPAAPSSGKSSSPVERYWGESAGLGGSDAVIAAVGGGSATARGGAAKKSSGRHRRTPLVKSMIGGARVGLESRGDRGRHMLTQGAPSAGGLTGLAAASTGGAQVGGSGVRGRRQAAILAVQQQQKVRGATVAGAVSGVKAKSIKRGGVKVSKASPAAKKPSKPVPSRGKWAQGSRRRK